MSDAIDYLSGFAASPSGLAIKALLVAMLLTFVLGIFAALRDGTFQWQYVDSFVRSTLWGRVAPVGTALLLGYTLDPSGIITAAAIVAAGAVAAGMIAAALASIGQIASPKAESATTNTPPTA